MARGERSRRATSTEAAPPVRLPDKTGGGRLLPREGRCTASDTARAGRNEEWEGRGGHRRDVKIVGVCPGGNGRGGWGSRRGKGAGQRAWRRAAGESERGPPRFGSPTARIDTGLGGFTVHSGARVCERVVCVLRSRASSKSCALTVPRRSARPVLGQKYLHRYVLS